VTNIPKADMHVHLEGTITPEMVQRLAARNKVTVPEGLIKDGRYSWQGDGTARGDLIAFVHAYDLATSVMKTAADYTDITYDYLKRSADEGCIYAEVGISADHGAMVGLTYPQMLEAITRGYEKAKKETGIEARFISTCVRHYGPDGALKAGQITRDNPHPLVTGFGMAGDENAYTVADFKPAFDISGLPHRTAHAGEAAGPESVRAARDILKTRRFGHMVRAIEDKKLIEELKAGKAVPEVCVSSNLVLHVFEDYASHPLRKFFDAGLKVVLGSDDPSFFSTSIGREYQIAKEHFGFSDKELRQITRNAIEEAFVDEKTRQQLFKTLDEKTPRRMTVRGVSYLKQLISKD
jgi:adenosine deaminase